MNRTAGISRIIADGRGGLWIGSIRGLMHRGADGVIRAYPLPSATTAGRAAPNGSSRNPGPSRSC